MMQITTHSGCVPSSARYCGVLLCGRTVNYFSKRGLSSDILGWRHPTYPFVGSVGSSRLGVSVLPTRVSGMRPLEFAAMAVQTVPSVPAQRMDCLFDSRSRPPPIRSPV